MKKICLIICIFIIAFCFGMIAGYMVYTYDHPAFCSELEQKLYQERMRHHGIDKRFNSVWKENGKWYFRDSKGRTGRFI